MKEVHLFFQDYLCNLFAAFRGQPVGDMEENTPLVKSLEANMSDNAEVQQTPWTDSTFGNNLEACNPIKSLDALTKFLDTPPAWLKGIVDLQERSNAVVANKNVLCHTTENEANHIAKRIDSRLVPHTLVCHDMKNGYLDDKYVGSVKSGNGYTFYRWSQIDLFVYFSHHFITIPPQAWINIAHENSVKILGTIITEQEEGSNICKRFLTDLETMRAFVNAVTDVAVLCKLDGFLLNIENPIENTSMLIQFVKELTDSMHNKIDGSLVIWYDSVIESGKLKWQNELNIQNRSFFDVCDGIFLNYVWNEQNLLTTAKIAQHRIMDVYVGIDVFGRNTYGGGHFNCHLAADKIRSLNMSMAIFAPGWTHESLEMTPTDSFYDRYIHRDNAFWRSMWPFLYTHPISRFFETVFYVGADKDNYQLHKQQVQLTRFLHAPTLSDEDIKVPTLHGQCNCLQAIVEDGNSSCIITKNSDSSIVAHHLFTCDILVQGSITLYTHTKTLSSENDAFLNVILLVQESSGAIKKIVCSAIKRTNNIHPGCTVIDPVNTNPKTFNAGDEVPRNAALKCYQLKFNNPARILEVSGEVEYGNSVILCGFGLREDERKKL